MYGVRRLEKLKLLGGQLTKSDTCTVLEDLAVHLVSLVLGTLI